MISTPTQLALVVRILVALFTRTFFQPDEYFQSLEPAHHLVFGYGHLTWEWLTPKPIRSIVYPALNVPIFWLLKMSGLAEVAVIGDWFLVGMCFFVHLRPTAFLRYMQICSPKILHGVFASATDIWICKLTHRILGRDYVATVVSHKLSKMCLFIPIHV